MKCPANKPFLHKQAQSMDMVSPPAITQLPTVPRPPSVWGVHLARGLQTDGWPGSNTTGCVLTYLFHCSSKATIRESSWPCSVTHVAVCCRPGRTIGFRQTDQPSRCSAGNERSFFFSSPSSLCSFAFTFGLEINCFKSRLSTS